MELPDLYSEGLKAMKMAEKMPRGDGRQELYNKAKSLFNRAMDLVESLALFSDNESVEDIATSDLRYLIIPAYLAKITISSECNSNRLETFNRASDLVKRFFLRILNYGLGNKTIEHSLESDGVDQMVQSRSEKIEKYKKMKLLESQIEELEKRINLGEQVDDETARDYYLKLIKKWIDESYESLEREIKPAIFFEKSSSTSKQTPGMPKQIKPSITIVKNELQKQVFGLGYPSRPTVTVDEFISKKISDGDLAFHAQKEVYANSLQRYAEQPDLMREQEEVSDAEHDEKEDKDDEEELAKKRRWDEFKDENPRGSGNRHNMG